ncbi:MAG TPA: WbqC family protein [Pyrinomonadaceae bacterium]|nr:WbqC family protein [Pyrinomonadaceae bacterium]
MLESRVVAIHQPNFFPWLGYFNKLARADLFIVLDNVQFPKKGGTWLNRVRLMNGSEPSWITMPVVRAYHGLRRIDEIQIDNDAPWRGKVLKSIEINYGAAPFFDQVFPVLTELVNNPTDRLAEFNLSAIMTVARSLRLDTSKLILGSTLDGQGRSTDLLISMVKSVGGTAYLCGGGATGYQEDEKFGVEGLELIYQEFEHPVYPQVNTPEFVAGLSIIDALMNCGFEKTRLLINGTAPAQELQT